jgi:tripartite-type tricarboxylate transporter receptor subunit TctC
MRKFIFAACLFVLSFGAHAQSDYPNRPIHLVVPFAPGQVTDWLARFLGEQMSVELGQPVIIENRAGANGVVGNAYAVRQAADGYTLVISSNGTHAAAPSLTKNLAYDPIKDFTHIVALMSLPWTLMVRTDFPPKTLEEFIAYVRANPGKFTTGYGSASSRLSIHLLRTMAKLDFLDVPYKSLGQTIVDLRGGSLQFNFLDIGSAMTQISGGELRGLAVTSAQASPALPGIPAMSQALPGYQMTSWLAISAPAGTPEYVSKRIQDVIAKIMAKPDTKEKIAKYGGNIMTERGEQVASLIKNESLVWEKFAAEAGVQKE